MSQIALTNEERKTALRRFGYTEREAQFLCLVALHGGYFLRRQYEVFLARAHGGTATEFIEKALALGHAQCFAVRRKTNLYHICARPLYEAIGQVDNRNRRKHEPLTIKNRLMGLDFVLAHRDQEYLATEQEKLDYFGARLGIPRAVLPTIHYHSSQGGPATERYFVEKYPIFLPAASAMDALPVISFGFVDEGLKTLSRFETFLAQYSRLLASLAHVRLVYIAARATHFAGAERAFRRLTGKGAGSKNGQVLDPDVRRLLEYFAARRRYEMNHFDGFDRAKLIQLRKDREEFSGETNESLYERWQAAGNEAVLQILTPETGRPAQVHGTFSTCLLGHSYELFGSLTAI